MSQRFIYYDYAIANYIPFSMSVNLEKLPMLSAVVRSINTEKLDWSTVNAIKTEVTARACFQKQQKNSKIRCILIKMSKIKQNNKMWLVKTLRNK